MKKYSFLILLPFTILLAQTLYVNSNLYSSKENYKVGSILKVIISEGIKGEFEVENGTDDSFTIKSIPDKKMVSEIPPFNTDRSITKRNKGKLKSLGKIKGALSVIVTAVDGNGNLTFQGSRTTNFDSERQLLRVSGVVSPESISARHSVFAESVANLRLDFQGAIAPKNLTDPNVQLKTTTNPDGTTTVKAELSDAEKQTILLKYIKRMLGESE